MSILLDLWALAAVLSGVAAVVVARRDLVSPDRDRPRFASAGLVLGLLGLAFSAGLFLLWLLTPLSF